MGEKQLEETTADDLYYVPAGEFQRIRAATLQPVKEAAIFAQLCRINTLYMIARAWSGHIGTSFSALDIISWLFLRELAGLARGPKECDVFFSSKGHDAPALYAVLIAMGLLPEDKLHVLRRLDGLPGHPHVSTPFIQSNTGSLGMGISKAKGMALANRVLGTPKQIFVMTGDGELQEGQFWESLGSAANLGLNEITAIIDHNKIQSDTFVRDVSDLGRLEEKLRAFGWHVERVDGHDMNALQHIFRTLRGISEKPKVLIADTVKGKGVSFMEGKALEPGGLYLFHSGAPNEEDYARGSAELIDHANAMLREQRLGELALVTAKRPARKAALKVERLIEAYTRALLAQAKRHPELLVLDADLVKDCGLIAFRERYPDRFVECGIAEQDMVSVAAGMARAGALPFVHSFSCFLSSRPHEQIYNQCSEGSRVIYVGSLAGLLPGGPGHSHQAVGDIAALGAIPGLIMVEPCTEREVELFVEYVVERAPTSSYLRLTSVGWSVPFQLPADYRPEEGTGVIVREGSDVVMFGYGCWMLTQAWEAASLLLEEGISVRLVNMPWLNRVNPDWLHDVVGSIPHVVTVDNHYVHGGQGAMLAAAISGLGITSTTRVTRIGLTELPRCGTNEEVLRYHGLDGESLFRRVLSVIGANQGITLGSSGTVI
jgi:transketolase